MKMFGLEFFICFAVKIFNIISFQLVWFGFVVRNCFFFFSESYPRTRPYSHRTWTPHEPPLSFGRGFVQKGGVVRVRVYVCVRACVRVRLRAACDELPAVCAATVFASFSSSSSSLLFLLLSFSSVSVQSGNVDHRGLIHRVSPSSPAPCFWLRSVSTKWSGLKVSARHR